MARDHKIDNEKRLKSVSKHQKEQEKQKKALKNALSQSLNKGINKKKKIYHSSTDSEDDSLKPELNGSKRKKSRKNGINEITDEEYEAPMKKNKKHIEERHEEKMKSTHGNDDERFVLDDRFADEGEEDNFAVTAQEKAQNLKILDKIIGLSNKSQKRKSEQIGPSPKMIRYNPSKTEHKVYEINTNKKEEKIPEVSKEKFFDVSKSLIADLKDKKTENSSFSLTKLLKGESSKYDVVEETPIYFAPTPIVETDEKLHEDDQTFKKSKQDDRQTKRQAKSSQPFFFMANDPRLLKGAEFFHRTESLDAIRKEWITKRSEVKKQFDEYKKKTLHRLNPMHRLGNKKRFNHVNARKKRMQ